MSKEVPPENNEFEVSIFGPGRGECIVLHLGSNRWCVIDSYQNRVTRRSVATEYLESFGNGALDGVELIVATHWHDDHVRGLRDLLLACKNAEFCCSSALRCPEFVTLVQTAIDSGQEQSGVTEMASILETLQGRQGHLPKRLVAPKLALQNRTLLKLQRGDPNLDVSISSLSPADGTLTQAIAEFARWLPRPGEKAEPIPHQSGNHRSVVLWAELGGRRVLLGADLEHTGHAGEGWQAVLDSHTDLRKAEIYKVAHHGSTNGDHDDIWRKLLISQATAVITPYSSSNLPGTENLARIREKTSELYCTATGTRRAPRRENSVERELKKYSRRVVESDSGQVRLRWLSAEPAVPPRVELFGKAFKVQ
jgi:beta-lactamase superfamily II metal-dependent hydrolase